MGRLSHYAASKWGLVGFSKSVAEEVKGTNLVSVAVLPGSVVRLPLLGHRRSRLAVASSS